MNWNPRHWKKSTRLLLGLVTIWPVVYFFLFIVIVFGAIAYFTFRTTRANGNREDIDLIQLEQKIKNHEISQLTVKPAEIVACDQSCQCEYHTNVTNRMTRSEIVRQAREVDENGKARVAKIDVETAQSSLSPIIPMGVVVLFAGQMITVLLTMGLLALYIVLAVNNKGLDQTSRIVWIVMICLLSHYTMPVYWFVHIWGNGSSGTLTTAAK